jgi:Na+-translocating ferredoxin:NAD+ oxidoreductase RnfC subunit
MGMDTDAFIGRLRDAGVVGEGGAGFPAHVKYAASVETVIANGCECEPMLYSDQHIMETHAPEIVQALQAVVKATGASRGVIAIKRKYTRAAQAFQSCLGGASVELAQLDNFYPAGDEHILVHEVTGRTIPPLGLPKEVGALVANVGSLYSVSQALNAKPVTRKVVTVTGEVGRPSVIQVPIGTKVADCIRQCGGTVTDDPVYVMGGPMMGRFVDTPQDLDQAVITKTSGGVIVLPRGHYLHECATLPLEVMRKRAATACIQCRYCTDLCPRYLVGHSFETHKVMRAFGGGEDTAMGAMQALLCCECGVCELFSCPMRLSPRRINAAMKRQFSEQGVSYQGLREVRPQQSALRNYRKIPAPRLAIKLGISDYMDIHPQYAGAFEPDVVFIPLSQHIGAPAAAVVKVGDQVGVGDMIGEIPGDALGARVHASISGTVVQVNGSVVIERF